MMKKKNIICLLLLAVMFTGSACGDEKEILESSEEETAAVMTINGLDVPYELYRYVALNYKAQYEEGQTGDIWLGEDGQALLAELNENVNETLSRLYTTIVLCKEYGINIDDELITDSVDMQMDAIYEGYEYDYEAYDAAISEYNMNDGVYRFIIRNEVLTEELFNAMIERDEINTDEAYLTGLFNSDEFIRVKQILVSSGNGNTDEENKARAEELLAMVNGGGDFEELVQKHGQDLYMFNNDDGYYIMKGSYYQEFEDAAFALDVGEVSGIVESSAGYSIIKRYEKDTDYIEENFDALAQTYFDSVYNTRLEESLTSITVETTDLYDDYTIFTME